MSEAAIMLLIIFAIVVGCAVLAIAMILKLKSANHRRNAYQEKVARAIEENRHKP